MKGFAASAHECSAVRDVLRWDRHGRTPQHGAEHGTVALNVEAITAILILMVCEISDHLMHVGRG